MKPTFFKHNNEYYNISDIAIISSDGNYFEVTFNFKRLQNGHPEVARILIDKQSFNKNVLPYIDMTN